MDDLKVLVEQQFAKMVDNEGLSRALDNLISEHAYIVSAYSPNLCNEIVEVLVNNDMHDAAKVLEAHILRLFFEAYRDYVPSSE